MPTKSPTSREIRARESRRKIFETAVQLFEKKGYENVSIAEICKKAGFSTGSFYYYFKSKDQIMEERYLPFALQIDSFFKSINRSVQEENQSSIDKLTKFTETYLEYVNNVGVEALKTAYRLQIEPGSAASPRTATLFKPHDIVIRIIEEGQKAGDIRTDISAPDISAMLYNFVFGILYSWCFPNASFDLREAGKLYLDLVLDGLRKR
jgi:TetR/AcrR family transcriptional regulator, fatty acid metabolism regulator protein